MTKRTKKINTNLKINIRNTMYYYLAVLVARYYHMNEWRCEEELLYYEKKRQ